MFREMMGWKMGLNQAREGPGNQRSDNGLSPLTVPTSSAFLCSQFPGGNIHPPRSCLHLLEDQLEAETSNPAPGPSFKVLEDRI